MAGNMAISQPENSNRQKILMVCPKYSSEPYSPYLTNDLAKEMTRQNCMVLAVGYGDRTVNNVSQDGSLEEVIIKIKKHPKYIKYMVAWLSLFFAVRRMARNHKDVDRIIFFAPLTVLWPAVLAIRSSPCGARLCIIFDIYPAHQIQINALPRSLSAILKTIETRLLSRFNRITGMSPANIDAIKKVYGSTILTSRFLVLPPWGTNEEMHGPDSHRPVKSSTNRLNIVFGGQICHGRDFGKAIHFLHQLKKRGFEINLSVFTDELSAQFLGEDVQSHSWVKICKPLPRNEYLNALTQFDFGLIVTDPQVTLPTFPSKIVDYLDMRLRCLCLLEKTTDFDRVLPFPNIIHVNRFAFDEEALDAAAAFISRKDHDVEKEFRAASNRLSVKSAVKVILG